MSPNVDTIGAHSFATLRALASPRRPADKCELCSLQLSHLHRHLLETATRRIRCACDACALTFENVVAGRFKTIPRAVRLLPQFELPEGVWESLGLPINLAFIFQDSRSGKHVAMYPSPGGATESLLPLEAWDWLATENPLLQTMTPDVEALLVNRLDTMCVHLIAPIDRCFEVVGLIRRHWRGLSGGEQVKRELQKFFEGLTAEARPEIPIVEPAHV